MCTDIDVINDMIINMIITPVHGHVFGWLVLRSIIGKVSNNICLYDLNMKYTAPSIHSAAHTKSHLNG